MFDHVTFRVSDRSSSEPVYTAILATLGIVETGSDEEFFQYGDFTIAQAREGRPVTRGVHVGFRAPSRAAVDAFWQAGTAAGWESDGEPGLREYTEDYYGAFLLDPDGNSVEAVHYTGMRGRGQVDHLWIRVADVPAAQRFYELVGRHAGFALGETREGYALFDGGPGRGSFSLLDDRAPSEHLHFAFPGTTAQVDAFHRDALAAGHRDHGAPGERAHYHPGYYAAFVLDPDGNNVEVVDHRR
jgi:catechol 2,3-dioxygenase-like lactoylglutathione lyase family enzyme